MKKRSVRVAFAVLGPTLCAAWSANAQEVAPDLGTTALAKRVPKFSIHDATLLDGIAQLSAGSLELSFAFEDVLTAKFGDPPMPHSRFDLNLENRTISEVLDALCERDVTFQWTRDGSTVNIFPRSTVDDTSYLPNRRLAQFELRRVTDTEQAVFAAAAQLPPPFEQIACVQAGGDTSYAIQWNASFRDLTVRQAFNLIARELGPRGGWVFGGSRDFRTIGFYKGKLQKGGWPSL